MTLYDITDLWYSVNPSVDLSGHSKILRRRVKMEGTEAATKALAVSPKVRHF